MVVLSAKCGIWTIVRSQGDSLQERVVHARFGKRIAQQPKLLDDSRGTTAIVPGAFLEARSDFARKAAQTVGPVHRIQEIDRKPAEVEPGQRVFPFPLAERIPRYKRRLVTKAQAVDDRLRQGTAHAPCSINS